jgi:hypothetical protein
MFIIIIIIIIIIITIIIIIIISITLIVTCVLGIYNYTPEINRVSKVNSVAAVLYLQFILHVMLFRQLNAFCIIIIISPKIVTVYCCVELEQKNINNN